MRVVVVGGGAVADGLAREFARTGMLTQQWSRKTHAPADLAAADLYVLAVSDRAVGEVSAALPFASGAVAAHTAGCVHVNTLSPLIEHRAVLYPLQSFTRGREIADFRRTPFFVEGLTPHALEIVRAAARTISDSVTELSSERRERLHLAGALANNFTNAMLSLAEIAAADAGCSFDDLRPIVAETLAKAMEMPSPRLAQTGAASRGDIETQARHVELLRSTHPELIPIYQGISEIIWKTLKKN